MFNRIVEHVLSEGCRVRGGISGALRSPEFQELLSRFQAAGASTDSKRSEAYRLGPLALMQTMLRRPKYDQAFSADPYFRATVQYVGRKLIEAADALLPPEAECLAAEWRAGTSDRQLDVAGRACALLADTSRWRACRIRNADDETKALGGHFLDFVDQPLERNLPARVAASKRIAPNCLLCAIMTLAFARRCDAKAYLSSPTSSSVDLGAKLLQFYEVGALILAHHRNFRTEDALEDFVVNGRAEGSLTRLWASNFHAGAILGLDDGRWVAIDPYAGTWGQVEGFNSVRRVLEHFHDSVPGLSIPFDDGGRGWKAGIEFVTEHLSALPTRLAVSDALGDELRQAIDDSGEVGISISDVLELLPRSELYAMILREENISRADIEGEGGDDFFAFRLLEAQASSGKELFESNDELLRAIRRLSAYPLEVAERDFRDGLDRLLMNGGILHPWSEYTAAEFGAGLRVLREAALAFDDFSTLRDIAAESSSQLSLYDRIHFFDDEDARSVARAIDAEECHSAIRMELTGTMLTEQSIQESKESAACLGIALQTLGLTRLEAPFEEEAHSLMQSAISRRLRTKTSKSSSPKKRKPQRTASTNSGRPAKKSRRRKQSPERKKSPSRKSRAALAVTAPATPDSADCRPISGAD